MNPTSLSLRSSLWPQGISEGKPSGTYVTWWLRPGEVPLQGWWCKIQLFIMSSWGRWVLPLTSFWFFVSLFNSLLLSHGHLLLRGFPPLPRTPLRFPGQRGSSSGHRQGSPGVCGQSLTLEPSRKMPRGALRNDGWFLASLLCLVS